MAVFRVVVPCSLVEVYQRFRGAYSLHHQGDDGGSHENLKSHIVEKFGKAKFGFNVQ
jgi:hypothetical protein